MATLACAENFTAAARRAAVCAGIFPALLNGFERAQLQPQFAHFFFVRALRALAAAPQPWPAKRHIAGLRGRDNSKLRKAAAAELFLQLGALHEGHTAHLHGAPDHSCRVTPLLRGNPLDSAPLFPQFRFSNYAGHFSKELSLFQLSMRKIFEIASREDCGNRRALDRGIGAAQT